MITTTMSIATIPNPIVSGQKEAVTAVRYIVVPEDSTSIKPCAHVIALAEPSGEETDALGSEFINYCMHLRGECEFLCSS